MAWSQARKEKEKDVEAKRLTFVSYYTGMLILPTLSVVVWLSIPPLAWFLLSKGGLLGNMFSNLSDTMQSMFFFAAFMLWIILLPILYQLARWPARYSKGVEEKWVKEKSHLNALNHKINELEGMDVEFGLSLVDDSEDEEGALSMVDVSSGALSKADEDSSL